MPTSSFGCLIFDALIAVWFLAGAPSLFSLFSRAPSAATDAPPRQPEQRSARGAASGRQSLRIDGLTLLYNEGAVR